MALDILLARIIQILLVPTYEPSVIWVIIPLLFGLVMSQLYFGKHKNEQLGWNTAFGNTVSLMWATVFLTRYMYETYGLEQAWQVPGLRGQLFLIGGVGLLTFLLMVINYEHALSRRLAFLLSNTVPTTILAYLAIQIVIGRIPVDWLTLWAGMFILAGFWAVMALYKSSITPPKDVQRRLAVKKQKEKQEIKKIERKIVHKIGKVMLLKER